MKTVLLNVQEEQIEVIDVENSLEAWYEALGCNLVEIDRRRIGGRVYEVMCDEEGTFVDDPKISAINDMGSPMFVGNLMFFNDGGEELKGLTDDDVRYIVSHIQKMYTLHHPQGYPMLTQCEYA